MPAARVLGTFIIGLLFGGGLIVSGMINPAKVIGFLDIFGQWDPSLAFVMGGAVLVTSVGYRLVFKRSAPAFAESFSVPAGKDIDAELVVGPVLFGVGWGLVGLCPGPAFTALTASPVATVPFFVAMLAGMWLGRARPGSAAATRMSS